MVAIRLTLECPGPIAHAESLHATFLSRLRRYTAWLEQDHNADRVVLLYLLESAIDRRRSGVWQDADDLPPAFKLDAALPRKNHVTGQPSARTRVGSTARRHQERIERAAVALIDHLSSDAYLMELERLPVAHALGHLADIIGGLAASGAGASYLTHTATAPMESDGQGLDRRPAFHLSRLTEVGRDRFDPVGPQLAGTRTLVQSIATIAGGVLPGALAQAHLDRPVDVGETFVQFYRPVVVKFYTSAELQRHGLRKPLEDLRTGEDFTEMLASIREVDAADPARFQRWGPQVLSGLDSFLGVMDLTLQLDRLLRDGGMRNLAGFLGATASAVVGIADATTSLQRSLGREVSKARLDTITYAGRMVGVLGIGLSVWDGTTAFRHEDYSVAFGHGLGIAGSVALMTANPIGLAAGVALTLIGAGIVAFTQDEPEHPLLQMFSKSWFGTDWAQVSTRAGPETLEYHWKHRDGLRVHPDLSRQISTFLSLLHPVTVGDAMRDLMKNHLHVTVEPSFAYLRTQLEISLVEGGATMRFRIPLDSTPSDWERTGWLEEVVVEPKFLEPDTELTSVTCVIDLHDEARGTDDWIEAGVPLPGAVARSVLDAAGGDHLDAPTTDEATRITLRGRGGYRLVVP